MSALSALQSELASLSEGEAASLLNELRWDRARADKNAYWQNLCDNAPRDEIIKAAQEYSRSEAVGLACDYDNVSVAQELVAWAVRYHPRRPVMMKGSKTGRIWRHSLTDSGNPNGYAIELFWRYFRMRKVTAFDQKDLPDWIQDVRWKIRDRYRCVTHSYRNGIVPDWIIAGGGCFINGKDRWLKPSEKQNLRGLYAILRKTESLEERTNALRLHFKRRMQCD